MQAQSPPMSQVLTPADPNVKTFVYVASVRNPATKGRNVRYRLAARAGWKCTFTLVWDITVVSRNEMKQVVIDAGRLGGLGDGIKIGCGRFEVMSYGELTDGNDTDESEEEVITTDADSDDFEEEVAPVVSNGKNDGRSKRRVLFDG